MHFYKRLTKRLNRQNVIDRFQLQPWTVDTGALKYVILNRKPENWSLDFVLVAKVLFWSPCLHEMHMKPCRIVLVSRSNFVLAACALHRYRVAKGRGGNGGTGGYPPYVTYKHHHMPKPQIHPSCCRSVPGKALDVGSGADHTQQWELMGGFWSYGNSLRKNPVILFSADLVQKQPAVGEFRSKILQVVDDAGLTQRCSILETTGSKWSFWMMVYKFSS